MLVLYKQGINCVQENMVQYSYYKIIPLTVTVTAIGVVLCASSLNCRGSIPNLHLSNLKDSGYMYMHMHVTNYEYSREVIFSTES